MPLWLLQIVGGVVLNLVVSLAQQAFAPKPEASIRGFRGQYSSGGTTPLKIVLGTYGVPGHLEYSNTWGAAGKTPNAYLADVLSLSDYLIEGVTAAWLDSQPVTLPGTGVVTQGYPIPEYADGGSDYAWYRFLDGSQSVALSYLTAKFGSDPDRPWEAGMVGEGIAQAVMTSRIHETLWTGFPAYMFELEGAPLLDPRESTALGGSGSQVWGTVSTYAFSDNNMVLIYNILRGIHDADGNHIWGGRATAYQLPYAAWAAAMDRCDDAINLNGGGTEKRYRAGIEIGVNERPVDVIRELLVGCNGRIAYHQGQYFPIVDVPEGAADGSFIDADTLADQPIRSSPFPNLDDVVNGATATFMAPQRAWESKETAPYYRADLEEEDDDRRLLESLTLRTVFSGTQAQRILKEVVEESRRFKRHVVPFPPAFGVYRPLQVLEWTSDEFQYTAKKFLVTAKTEDEWGNIVLGLHEIDPADNDWDETTDETALTFAPLTPTLAPAQDADDFDAAGTVFLDNDGASRRPGIEVTVAGGLDDVRGVLVEVSLDGSSDVEFGQELPYDPDITAMVLPREFLPATDYEVRGWYVPRDGSGRITNPSAWIPVTTPDVRLSPADLGDTLTNMNSHFALSIRELNENIQLATAHAADQDIANYAQHLYALERSAVGDDDTYAESVRALLLAVGADGSTIADAISAIEARSGDAVAGMLSRVTAQAGPDGASVQYGMQIRAQFGGPLVTVEDYWSINTVTGEATKVSRAAKQYILDELGNVIALYDSSGAYIRKAVIPELTVEKLEIVARGLTFEDIVFEHNVSTVGGAAVSNSAAWTAGTVRYVNDAGTAASAAISAGSIAWTSGVGYVYWTKGATSFSTTTSAATAFATNNVVVGTYQGGSKLVLTWGKLVIDGNDGLKALSVITGAVAANAISVSGADVPASDTQITTSSAGDQTWVDVATITVVPNGGSTVVLANALLRCSQSDSSAFGPCAARILRDGVSVATAESYYDDITTFFPCEAIPLMYLDTAAQTTSHTYKLQCRNASPSAGKYLEAVAGSGIMAINMKK